MAITVFYTATSKVSVPVFISVSISISVIVTVSVRCLVNRQFGLKFDLFVSARSRRRGQRAVARVPWNRFKEDLRGSADGLRLDLRRNVRRKRQVVAPIEKVEANESSGGSLNRTVR